MSLIAFFDLEVNPEKKKILDIGSVRSDGASFHKNHIGDFSNFIKDAAFLYVLPGFFSTLSIFAS